MKLQILLIVTQHICYALSTSRYAIGSGCSKVRLEGGSTVDYKEGIVDGMREALEIVDDAYDVLENHLNERDVQKICETVLGDDSGKLGRAKATIGRLKAFTKDPFPFPAEHDQWRQIRSNTDVEIYCSMDRFLIQAVPDKPNQKILTNTQMANDRYNVPKSNTYLAFYEAQTLVRARTTDSDYFNGVKWVADLHAGTRLGKSRQDPEYATPRPNLPAQIDLATFAMEEMRGVGWPRIDETRIDICMQEDFITKYLAESNSQSPRSPIGALQNLAQILLHELTHTTQGGYLMDNPTKEQCYGWLCVVTHKDPSNADTIAWLAIALKLWKMGYMTNDKGELSKLR